MSHYLKACTDKLLISIKGYKTPKRVIEKINRYDYLLVNPPFKTKKS